MDAKTRTDAIGKLAERGESAVPLLLEIWGRGDPNDAQAVVLAIKKLKPNSPQIVAVFCKSIRTHANATVREYAAIALESLGGGGDTVPSLMAGMKDTETIVVTRCVCALQGLGPVAKAACPDLATLANRVIVEKRAEVGEMELFTASHAVRALSRIDPVAHKDLILRLSGELIRDRKKHRTGWSASAVWNAALTLENMDCSFKEASALLAEYIDDPDTPKEFREPTVQAAKNLLDRRVKRLDK
jgi:hypothetical protein